MLAPTALALASVMTAVVTDAGAAPEWHHLGQRSLKAVELSYVQLTTTCQNAHAISGDEVVPSVAACEVGWAQCVR